MIIAVAGHVDHGKTTLVRALTGVDTDRLPEEKRRGMTIEPGYAHVSLDGGPPIDFVDVPGHAGFVRQAMVGMAAADAALLVVACDDGPMPQTRDHLALLQLLGIRHGVIALSKTDHASADRLAQVRAEVLALVKDTVLDTAPMIAVSAAHGEGIADLREAILHLQRATPPRKATGAFRMAVDRAFLRPGAGTVVTGTILSGQVHPGEVLCISPSGEPVRVRSVQRHGESVDTASAGERCALALPGAERDWLARGAWLLSPTLHAPTQRVDVRLDLLVTAPRAIDGHIDVQLHIGAAVLNARVVMLQPQRLAPGDSGCAQLLLSGPVSALHGDRFVLRDPAAHALLGGGVVLDDSPPIRGRRSVARLSELTALQGDDPKHVLAELLAQRAGGVDEAAFARQWNLDAAALDEVRLAQSCRIVPTRCGLLLLGTAHWQALHDALLQALDKCHVEEPARVGMPEPVLLRSLQGAGTRVDNALVRQAVLRAAISEGLVVRDGFVLRRPKHEARLNPADAELLDRVRVLLQPTGLRPPPLGDLAPLLDLPLDDATAALARMALLGHVVQVAKNRFFLPETVQALMEVARRTARSTQDGRFDAARFRDSSGLGRNLSIQLLEFFDRIGFTRFRAQRRVLSSTSPAPASVNETLSSTE